MLVCSGVDSNRIFNWFSGTIVHPLLSCSKLLFHADMTDVPSLPTIDVLMISLLYLNLQSYGDDYCLSLKNYTTVFVNV